MRHLFIESIPAAGARGAERRRFERVEIPASAGITVWDADGSPIGSVCELSRGGMRIKLGEPDAMHPGEDFVFIMRTATDDSFSAWVQVRHVVSSEAGCEFQNLDPSVATHITELMGVYYDFQKAASLPATTH